MRKAVGYALIAVGSWMLVSPQSLTGLAYLKWMHKYAFAGEPLMGMAALCAAYYCLDFKAQVPDKPSH